MYLSVSSSHIVVSQIVYKPHADLLRSFGGRVIPVSRREGLGLSVQFPRQTYIINMIRRAIGKIEEDQTVEEFLNRSLIGVDREEINVDLFEYQKDCVQFLTGGNRLLAVPPGRGKTPVTIESARLMEARRILIVCPIILIRQWEEEIRKWDPRDLPIHIYRTSKVEPFLEGYTIVNYEMIVRNLDLFKKNEWDLMVLDESILIKNRQTTRFKKLIKLRPYVHRAWLLSGFPMTRDITDLWTQLHFIEPTSFRSFWRFASEFARVVQGTWGAEILGTKPGITMESEFPDLTMSVDENVIDIPSGTIERLHVDLTPTQKIIYRRAQKEFILQLSRGDVPIQNRLTQMMRLSQIVGNLSTLGNPSESGKLNALLEMYEIGYLRPPVLIWGRFTESLKGIHETLQKTSLSVRVIDGSTSEENRQDYLSRFKGGDLDVLVMQTSIGKFGLNLTETRTMVYYEVSFNLDDLLQSYYRVFRIGLNHEPSVYALSASGTIDELVSLNLREKTRDLTSVTQTELVNMFKLLEVTE